LGNDIPDAHAPDIRRCLLLQEGSYLLDLGLAAGGVKEQVAQLAAVGLDIDSSFACPRIALEHQDLVFGPTFLLYGIHCVPGVARAEPGKDDDGVVEAGLL
jgi:hypothetical protein